MQNWKKMIVLFMVSQTISLLGSMLVMYAIMWHITLSTSSGLMMTIYVLCSFIPGIIMMPFAGVWADRLDRKKLMIYADLLIAFVTLIIAIVFIIGIRDLWIVFIVAVIRAFGQAIHQPAVLAVYPSIVPKDKLLKVQGISQGIQSASLIIMPLLAGLLLSLFEIEFILFIDVVTALIAVVMLLTVIHIPKNVNKQHMNEIKYMEDIKNGIKYARQHKLIFSILMFAFVYMILVAAPSFLTYLQVARVFGPEAWRLSILETLFGVGMLLGSIVIALWGGFKNRMITFFLSYMMIGIGTMGLGVPFNFWVYVSMWSFVGFFISISSPIMTTLTQEKVDPEYIGRIFSVFGLINTVSLPLGMLLFGPLSDVVDISLIILLSGLGMVVLSSIMMFIKTLIKEGFK